MEKFSLGARFGRNLAALAIGYALFFIGVRAGTRFEPAIQDTFALLGAGIGLWMAFRLRAAVASMIIAGFVLMIAVELAFHLIFGYHAVQSGPTHLAVMFASILGIVLGTVAMPRFVTLRSRTS
ncbi:MAG TPA: hypothetical protein VN605_03860 [Thermoanaerobaculia bacterium]|nr:hypothetical protein [Thermoanaerobaculia bacterium]